MPHRIFWVLWCVVLLVLAAACGSTGGDDDDNAPIDDDDDDDDNDVDDVDDDDNNDNDNDTAGGVGLPETSASSPYCGGSHDAVSLAEKHLGNGLVEVRFDAATGSIRQLADLRHDVPVTLLDEASDAEVPPYELFAIQRALLTPYDLKKLNPPTISPEFTCVGNTLTIRWAQPLQPTVEATWTADPTLPELRTTVAITGASQRMIHRVRYPIFAPLTRLADDDRPDRYLTSVEGGLLLNDPLDRLVEELFDGGTVLSNHRYPVGHEAMAQMVALLHDGVGGLLVYTADGEYGAKSFDLIDRAHESDDGEKETFIPSLHVAHLNPDVADEDGDDRFAIGYPVVLRWLDTGRWQEAAEIYRGWSDTQPWSAEPVVEREPEERAFFERTGATVFGMSSREEQRPWITAFHEALVADNGAAQLLFVMGWDFHPMGVPEPESYYGLAQAGRDERFWRPFFPAVLDSLERIAAQGDQASLFYYDTLVGSRVPGWDAFQQPPGEPSYFDYLLINPQARPGGFVQPDTINKGMLYTLDPAHPETQSFWLWRDRLLVDESPVPLTALYYDLGFSVILRGCYDHLAGIEHGHPSGAGRWMIQAVRDTLDQPRGMPNPRGFRYGAENAPEPYVDLIDFYHLGASGMGPLRNKIAGSDPPVYVSLQRWIIEGTGREVPLFAYLHHHHGALRTGGKLQISYELGDVFYWIAQAEYLWGGVVELIYFNTSVDWLPGMDGQVACPESAEACGFHTSWGFNAENLEHTRRWYYDDEVRRADPAKLDYLRAMIDLRVNSPAAPYLVYGRMEAPPDVTEIPPLVDLTYSYYSSINGPDAAHAGTWRTQPLRLVAWRHPDGDRVMVLAANAANTGVATTLVVDPAAYGFGAAEVWRVGWGESEGDDVQLAVGAEPVNVAIELPPHGVRLWEVVAADAR